MFFHKKTLNMLGDGDLLCLDKLEYKQRCFYIIQIKVDRRVTTLLHWLDQFRTCAERGRAAGTDRALTVMAAWVVWLATLGSGTSY